PRVRTYTGEVRAFGAGEMRSWVTIDTDGTPLALGVTLSEAAMTGWPTKPESTLGTVHLEDVLHLPEQASMTAFDHVGVSWQHRGHEPYGVYDLKHIDLHFFTISEQERMKITTVGSDTAAVFRKPCDDCTPAGYIDMHVAAPTQGNHWVDAN